MQQVPKDPHEGQYTIVFESMDRLLERALIEGAGAMDLEILLFLQTWAAEAAASVSCGIRKAATGAVGGAYGSDCLLTLRTNDEVFPLPAEEGLTDRTNRGENEVQKPLAGSGGTHLKIPDH